MSAACIYPTPPNHSQENTLSVDVSPAETSPGYTDLSDRIRACDEKSGGSALPDETAPHQLISPTCADRSSITVQERRGPFNLHFCAKVASLKLRNCHSSTTPRHLVPFRPDLNLQEQLKAVQYEKECNQELFLDQQQRISQFELPQEPSAAPPTSALSSGATSAAQAGRTAKDFDMIVKDLKYRLKSIVASAVCYRVMANRRRRQKALQRLTGKSEQQGSKPSSPHQKQQEKKIREVGEMVNSDVDIIFEYVMNSKETAGDPCRAIRIAHMHSDSQLSKLHFWDLTAEFGVPSPESSSSK